ncbi:unnamed protein product, partial [Ectocarpus sp. 12 AP-2014]
MSNNGNRNFNNKGKDPVEPPRSRQSSGGTPPLPPPGPPPADNQVAQGRVGGNAGEGARTSRGGGATSAGGPNARQNRVAPQNAEALDQAGGASAGAAGGGGSANGAVRGAGQTRCFDIFNIALSQACAREEQRWFASTLELQLASLDICRACRSMSILHVRVTRETPRSLWSPRKVQAGPIKGSSQAR